MEMNKLFDSLKKGLIVSCQAENDDPFNKPEYVTLFAKAAIMGGAVGIRTEGFEKTKMIKENVNVPVVGLIKSYFEDGFVRITGSFKDVELLLETKCDIIAIDGTFREREGLSGPDFIEKVKSKYKNIVVMADISTYSDALACIKSGADCISTTLSGYTPQTLQKAKDDLPDFALIEELKKVSIVPIFAEGRFNTPDLAAEAIKLGAWSVVVGTAITRPRVVTGWYVNKIKSVN
jgi:N-acylglucosamine-6-phosphate 2-epimerase